MVFLALTGLVFTRIYKHKKIWIKLINDYLPNRQQRTQINKYFSS